MYGYDLLHIHDEISIFLTISTKMVLVKHMYILNSKNQTGIFQNENSGMKTHINCVSVNVLEQSTNYSILYILSKNKILTKQT